MTTTEYSVDRRTVLKGAGLGAVVALVPLRSFDAEAAAAPSYDGVFGYGVASGDPTATAVVIWTRATPPGRVCTCADSDHTVKVDVQGLQPYTGYWYRFQAAGRTSAVGRTQTTPDERGVLHARLPARHALHKADPDLRAAHAQDAWITIFDDHEVANNTWATGAENHTPGVEGAFARRRREAYEAYLEWMPFRLPDQSLPHRGTRFFKRFTPSGRSETCRCSRPGRTVASRATRPPSEAASSRPGSPRQTPGSPTPPGTCPNPSSSPG